MHEAPLQGRTCSFLQRLVFPCLVFTSQSILLTHFLYPRWAIPIHLLVKQRQNLHLWSCLTLPNKGFSIICSWGVLFFNKWYPSSLIGSMVIVAFQVCFRCIVQNNNIGMITKLDIWDKRFILHLQEISGWVLETKFYYWPRPTWVFTCILISVSVSFDWMCYSTSLFWPSSVQISLLSLIHINEWASIYEGPVFCSFRCGFTQFSLLWISMFVQVIWFWHW